MARTKMATPKQVTPSQRRNAMSSKKPRISSNVKKPRRVRPGMKALREIRLMQKSSDLLIQKLPFARVVRQIANETKEGMRWQKDALIALQEEAERVVIHVLGKVNTVAISGGRTTIKPRDFHAAYKIMDLDLKLGVPVGRVD